MMQTAFVGYMTSSAESTKRIQPGNAVEYLFIMSYTGKCPAIASGCDSWRHGISLLVCCCYSQLAARLSVYLDGGCRIVRLVGEFDMPM